MSDVSPHNVSPGNAGPDFIAEPTPVRGRDWSILEAVQAALKETGEFDDVYLSDLPESRGRGAGELKLAIIEPQEWDEIDARDDPDDVEDTVQIKFRLTLIVRHGDPVSRDAEVDRLLNVAKNVVDSQTLVRGLTIPGWTKLRRGRWERAVAPERRMTITGETAYWVSGDDQHDEAE